MKTVSTKLDADARRVVYAAATKDARIELECVRIADNKIQAADGFMLAEAEIETEGEGEVLIEVRELAKVKNSKELGGVVVVSNDRITLVGETTLEVRQVEGSFPKFEKIYPKGEPVFQIAFASKMLAKMAKIAGDNTIDLTFYGSERPCKFESGNITGLLMPVHRNFV